jgi:YHS domain-containing protein
MQLNTKRMGRVALLAFALIAIPLLVVFGQGKADPVNKTSAGLALKGYDAVAYFQEGRAVKGRSEFQHDWMGAKWYFTSAANRDLFAKEPAKYAPQFGGYCAWAVSNNYVYDGDPEVWRLVDGKLYLNYNKAAQKKWEQDIPGRIKKGNENWPNLHK